jgi:hypothetical protein
MKRLEGMALELFNKFSVRETGKQGNWQYLSNERKLEWMKEVLIMAKYFHSEVLATVKPLPNNQKIETVYASGYSDGVRTERTYLVSLFEDQLQKLLDEYEDFQYSIKARKK